ncbi:Protein-lysine N-methyltransferase rrg1 [Diatrype stigma]|uniref:Protein-lysine N-methyltransferase rrg1 n=1 Tax=Diatrype stigma TaxID=117547 RepID=A0AAN9UIP7_9PEZI
MPVSVADLPQVYTKPSCVELLDSLRKLHAELPVWSPATPREEIVEEYHNSAQSRREVAAYLSSIIKSSLEWIQDEDERELVWTEASRRLSERCGRAGMGEITRRWPFGDGNPGQPSFELIIREPPIVGDSLGLKTWGSSYTLARSLNQVGTLSHLLDADRSSTPLNVLELGSGTGLLGMAAAALWKTHVVLTDLPEIVPNLAFNVEGNRSVVEALGGSIEAGALTWGGTGEDDMGRLSEKNQFHIILIADALYDDDHPRLLWSAILDHLANDKHARAVLVAPLRDSTAMKLLQEFRSVAARGPRPLVCLEENTLIGQDDWGEDEETSLVECWWGVFGG